MTSKVITRKLSTITSKRQITIPKEALESLNVKIGDQIALIFKNGKVELEKAENERVKRYQAFKPLKLNNGEKHNYSENLDKIYD